MVKGYLNMLSYQGGVFTVILRDENYNATSYQFKEEDIPQVILYTRPGGYVEFSSDYLKFDLIRKED